jgi:hypothetical protein
VTITPAQRTQSMTVRLLPDRPAPVTQPANAATSGRAVGELSVESRPAGANVFVDGRLVGTTPLLLPDVAAGEHAIHLERDGYKRWASAVRIVAAERSRVAASLDQ